ncbi:hypothetical protein GGI23_007423 [Coemansia sp. RSA 2559]|nr:hypothetical protein GGI23_007423 [Coemansia sp. RSA 2559]
MDDFSWGNTRVVVGDGKRKLIVSDDKAFDPESIPQRRWGEYEADLASAGVLNAPPPNMNPTASSSREEERMTMYSRQSQVMMSNQMRVGSMYGYPVSAIGFSAGGPPNPHYAAMGGSTRSATPAAMVGITGANGVADQQRYSMAATAMAMQQPMDTIRSHVVSMYANNVTDYATVRSPSPAVTSSAGQLALTMAAAPLATQSMSYEHAAVGGLDISGVASMPEMAIHQQQQQQQQQQQRPMSFAPAPSYPGIGTLSDLGTFASSPSDSQLVEAIRKILGAADLNSLTKKKVRQQLCQEFNKDLTTRKDFISDTVDRILSGNM